MHCKQHPFLYTHRSNILQGDTTIHFHTLVYMHAGSFATPYIYISVIRLARYGIYLIWSGMERMFQFYMSFEIINHIDALRLLLGWVRARVWIFTKIPTSKNTLSSQIGVRWIPFLCYNHVALFVFISCIAFIVDAQCVHHLSLSLSSAPLFVLWP